MPLDVDTVLRWLDPQQSIPDMARRLDQPETAVRSAEIYHQMQAAGFSEQWSAEELKQWWEGIVPDFGVCYSLSLLSRRGAYIQGGVLHMGWDDQDELYRAADGWVHLAGDCVNIVSYASLMHHFATGQHPTIQQIEIDGGMLAPHTLAFADRHHPYEKSIVYPYLIAHYPHKRRILPRNTVVLSNHGQIDVSGRGYHVYREIPSSDHRGPTLVAVQFDVQEGRYAVLRYITPDAVRGTIEYRAAILSEQGVERVLEYKQVRTGKPARMSRAKIKPSDMDKWPQQEQVAIMVDSHQIARILGILGQLS
jgi:hypothetical protein